MTTSAYLSVRESGAGLIDLSSRGRIALSGSEVVMFLNGLITNDMKTLAVNSWMPAVFPNVQGRMLAAARVMHHKDDFLIDTEPATHQIVVKLLERFTMAGDFKVADVTNDTAMLSLQGRAAAEILRKTLGEDAANLGRGELSRTGQVTVIRATHTAEDGFDLICARADAGSLADSLTGAGAQPIDPETSETLRIEAGIHRFGIDMDDKTVVTETNLDDSVSFTKGCYLGQEIIIRIKHRGHVAKKLTGIVVKGDEPMARGARVFGADQKEIGRITSCAFSPRLESLVALGYVKYDHLEPGTAVEVEDGDERRPGEVGALPFVRGGWYADPRQMQMSH